MTSTIAVQYSQQELDTFLVWDYIMSLTGRMQNLCLFIYNVCFCFITTDNVCTFAAMLIRCLGLLR